MIQKEKAIKKEKRIEIERKDGKMAKKIPNEVEAKRKIKRKR